MLNTKEFDIESPDLLQLPVFVQLPDKKSKTILGKKTKDRKGKAPTYHITAVPRNMWHRDSIRRQNRSVLFKANVTHTRRTAKRRDGESAKYGDVIDYDCEEGYGVDEMATDFMMKMRMMISTCIAMHPVISNLAKTKKNWSQAKDFQLNVCQFAVLSPVKEWPLVTKTALQVKMRLMTK